MVVNANLARGASKPRQCSACLAAQLLPAAPAAPAAYPCQPLLATSVSMAKQRMLVKRLDAVQVSALSVGDPKGMRLAFLGSAGAAATCRCARGRWSSSRAVLPAFPWCGTHLARAAYCTPFPSSSHLVCLPLACLPSTEPGRHGHSVLRQDWHADHGRGGRGGQRLPRGAECYKGAARKATRHSCKNATAVCRDFGSCSNLCLPTAVGMLLSSCLTPQVMPVRWLECRRSARCINGLASYSVALWL